MLTSYATPLTRADFEARVGYSAEQCRMGLIHFAKGLRGTESLTQVRCLPNGRIDLLSIDEAARLHANMMYQMRNFTPSVAEEGIE
ncbi:MULTISPECIES: AVAST type 1 anti-phage system protein Avs1c [Pseudomonas]|jgi:hypothetical protein|uniref:AVAST type 1 anti-phage system protein Avs1c n=1 Tax=Pseudomonas TaxID=286 RepID=UPI0003574BE1|nr:MULTISPECIES: AVAST type 1 anti-phage system protein Avs1c [Pseudomonas]OKP67343.1 hypothetical protein BTR19_23920 [Pseudomonas fluorescens]EPJ80509.1 hypothetical protein CFT9_21788 [Pseudomonas sp. CFT9]EPL09654.1 hypothetical protein CF150_17838 [Pseudomonas sp. CF150]MCF5511900.1 hypothetical protein [Pseudomonas sp. PA-3-6H]MCF5517467.1 hypothetical protein [Pseudomonas sp. PA-3-6E]